MCFVRYYGPWPRPAIGLPLVFRSVLDTFKLLMEMDEIHTHLIFAENAAALIDSNGLIVEHDTRLPRVLFAEADLCKLYGKPVA